MSIGIYPDFIDDPHAAPACYGVDTNLFFPEAGERGDAAKAICATCPLLVRCRDWALKQPSNDVHGIWGGLSDSDRLRLRRTPRGGTVQPIRKVNRKQPTVADHHQLIVSMLNRKPQPATWAEIGEAIGYTRDAVKGYWHRQKRAAAELAAEVEQAVAA